MAWNAGQALDVEHPLGRDALLRPSAHGCLIDPQPPRYVDELQAARFDQ